ncbi:MAG: NADP-dependent malic enzyme [Chloroflexi bacterium]|nr:NADP-dependent malic enzyme [Chloroflexota bacterium]
MSGQLREEALRYHSEGRPGKIQVVPTKPTVTQRHLSLAYTPGVAIPVEEIDKNPALAYQYTAKGNLVAVVSNGTAILGLGNRGPLAAKPVMEGKGVLFKRFADVDVFDIEIDTEDPDEIVSIVKALAPTFGGINLEDIKAPECFYVEEQLKEMLDIPVFHDDQHGTAIISGAGLLNALDIIGKKLQDITVVVNGAGAAGIACAEFYVRLGVQHANITMLDSRGVIYKGREAGMNPYKERFAIDTDKRTLAEALVGADVFVGVSVADIVTPKMVTSMADKPIIFALANPDPEIRYELAKEANPEAIVATGRSDYPNQVNNVLGFPFIFRGALDTHARSINDEMKVAAARALAALAREDVPDSVLKAYGLKSLRFGPDYIIPSPLDPRALLRVAPAVAQAAIDSGVAQKKLDMEAYRVQLESRLGKGWRITRTIINKAKSAPKRVVFAEGEELKIIRAAAEIIDEGIGEPILLGRPERVQAKIAELGLNFAPRVVNPRQSDLRDSYTDTLYRLRQRRGMTYARARDLVRNPNYFGPLMVYQGDADAFVSGLTYNYPDVLRPALQVVHTRKGVSKVAGVYILLANDRVYFFTDTTVNIDPTSNELAEIAILAADFAREFNIRPRIAMLSFSNFGSVRHPLTLKVKEAVEIVRQRRPDLLIDGEMQADTAVSPDAVDYPFSQVKDANVLVFPNLESANIAYKLVHHLGGAVTIGPILLGVGKPVHVLQTGDEVRDIVRMTAVAVMDAQKREE